MTEWRLTEVHSPNSELIAVLDESNGVTCYGDAFRPYLWLSLLWYQWKDHARMSVADRVLAVSANVYPSEQLMFLPWVQTGLVPRRSSVPFQLPIPHDLIQKLFETAQDRDDRQVVIYLDLQVLARDPDGQSVRIYESQMQRVSIDVIRWRKFMETWGYPRTKFLEISVALPKGIVAANPRAERSWQVAVGALEKGHQKWGVHDVQGAGSELRQAVQFALATWDAIWFPDVGNDEETWNDVAGRIADSIPGYRNMAIPQRSKPDVQRVFARLQLLRHLNALANAFHHVGAAPVYTKGDVETLVTSVTSVMRGLPDFWVEFPRCLSNGVDEQ